MWVGPFSGTFLLQQFPFFLVCTVYVPDPAPHIGAIQGVEIWTGLTTPNS